MTAYHGTDEETAESIMRSGFRPGTYFAYRRADAAKFGPVIFSVWFSDNPEMWNGIADGWQFHTKIFIPPTEILRAWKYGIRQDASLKWRRLR